MTIYQYPDYMYHYGVKGMKWGVRRYQNEDGTLTSIGLKRQKYLEVKKQTKQYTPEFGYVKREFRDSRDYDRLSSTKKSKRQLALEDKYKKIGYNDRDAQIAAYRRVRSEKRVAIAGGVAAVSLVAYAGYKHYDRVTDKILKEGSELGRVTVNKDEPLDRAFYAYTNNKRDKNKYQGLYGKTLSDKRPVADNVKLDVYNKTMSVSKNVKIASPETGRRVLSESLSKEQMRSLQKQLYSDKQNPLDIPARRRLYNRAYNDIKRGKITNNVYEAFNIKLVEPKNREMAKSYYSKLRDVGYGAIRDVNDYKYSGYGSKNPLIVFDSSHIDVDKVSTLGRDVINKKNTKESTKILAKATINSGRYYVGAAGALVGLSYGYDSKSTKKYVDNYLKEHPNTTKSRNELIKEYEQKSLL